MLRGEKLITNVNGKVVLNGSSQTMDVRNNRINLFNIIP